MEERAIIEKHLNVFPPTSLNNFRAVLFMHHAESLLIRIISCTSADHKASKHGSQSIYICILVTVS
jgi:hypothetical protein